MNIQLQMETQVNTRNHNVAVSSPFHLRSKPHSPNSSLAFRSSTVQQPLLPLLHKSNASAFPAKQPIPIIQVVSGNSVAGDHAAESSPAKALRRILMSPGIQQLPACFDALSAKLVERAGFQCCLTGGFAISGARLGLPDTGLISYGEMLEQGRQIAEAVSIPTIGDADNGYGNAMNVKRTVNGFIKAGFAGIVLEDQVSPKACGHTRGRKVVSREEAVMRIRAAIDAREESGSDIVIVARTDSRQAMSFEEAHWRTRAFADAGADVIFIDAVTSKQEMKAFCETAPLAPKLANMLEGGGKTPILDPLELEDVGYKLVVYPLSLIGVSIQAMQDALYAIRNGHVPSPGSMPSFEEIKEILGFNNYYEEEKRYAVGTRQLPSHGVSSGAYGVQRRSRDDAEQKHRVPTYPADVVEPNSPDVDGNYGSRVHYSGIMSRTLRIVITGRDGVEKLVAKIPVENYGGVGNLIPALGGVNMKALLDEAGDEVGVERLVDFTDILGDRIQVFLE